MKTEYLAYRAKEAAERILALLRSDQWDQDSEKAVLRAMSVWIKCHEDIAKEILKTLCKAQAKASGA